MKNIFIIIIVILAGLLFGFLLAKLFLKFSNWILGRKAKREILKGDNKLFKFKNQDYYLKQEIQDELNKRVKFKDKIKKIFHRKKKEVSQYGEPNVGNPGFKREQVSAINEGITTATNTTTSPARTTAKQPDTNPAETRREQRVINRGLFEERTKNHRLLL